MIFYTALCQSPFSTQIGHDISHLKDLVLEKVKSHDPFVLRAREFIFIEKFDTWNNGLNKEP